MMESNILLYVGAKCQEVCFCSSARSDVNIQRLTGDYLFGSVTVVNRCDHL